MSNQMYESMYNGDVAKVSRKVLEVLNTSTIRDNALTVKDAINVLEHTLEELKAEAFRTHLLDLKIRP